MFKVVPDQLRVSDGWVRCGQCNEVFDANLNLQTATTYPTIIPVHEADPQPEAHSIMSATESVAWQDSPEYPVNDPFLAVNPHALHLEPQEAVPDQLGEPQLEAAVSVDPEASRADLTDDHALVKGGGVPSFLQSNAGSSIGPRRSVRVLLTILCLTLCLILVVQFVLQERDRIVASAPVTQPVMDALCHAMGCTLAPFRSIESVVIDSSSFTKVRLDVYRLSLTLKNTAQVSVATPALELTLTDIQDQPVIRRVFMATDFGGKSTVMEAGAEFSVSLPISIKLTGSAEKISGYRLLIFYP